MTRMGLMLASLVKTRLKEEMTSQVSEATPKVTKYNTKWTVEKSSRTGRSDGKITVHCQNLLDWPVSNAKMFKI